MELKNKKKRKIKKQTVMGEIKYLRQKNKNKKSELRLMGRATASV